jgi:hypothetical protein
MALQCLDIAQHHPTPCHSTQHSPPLLLRPIVESQNSPHQPDRGRGSGRTARLKQICLDCKSRNLVRHHNAARPVLTQSARPVHGYVESLWIFRPAALGPIQSGARLGPSPRGGPSCPDSIGPTGALLCGYSGRPECGYSGISGRNIHMRPAGISAGRTR